METPRVRGQTNSERTSGWPTTENPRAREANHHNQIKTIIHHTQAISTQAIPPLHTFTADVNAAENIRHQGVEILAKAGNLSLGVPTETIAVNKHNKTRHKADPRCTHELALRKE